MNATPITIAILAGGQSTRMGQDKAALTLGGQTLLERTIGTAQAAADHVLVVGRSLPQIPEGVHCLADDPPSTGPMGGLCAALRHADGDVLAVACDMPNLIAAALRWLMGAARQRSQPDGLIAAVGAHPEPLFSVYAPSCLPLLERCLQNENYSLRALIGAGRFECVPLLPEFQAAVLNVNTPEEFLACQESAF